MQVLMAKVRRIISIVGHDDSCCYCYCCSQLYASMPKLSYFFIILANGMHPLHQISV